MIIDIINEVDYPFVKELNLALATLLQQLGLQNRELTVVLCNDTKIKSLNFRDRNINQPTDVLSYPTFEPDDLNNNLQMPKIAHLGDIIISVDTAAQQALAKKHSLNNEVKILAAHGLTHLLGFDHQTKKQWQIFKKHQKQILNLWVRSSGGWS